MVAAPKSGTLLLSTPNGNRTRSVDLYASDVDAGLINWDEGLGASSSSATRFVVPFTGYIIDFDLEADMTDTNVGQLTINGAPSGDFLRWLNHISTAERSPLRIPIAKGSELGMIQRA